jgi:hypothetical protein
MRTVAILTLATAPALLVACRSEPVEAPALGTPAPPIRAQLTAQEQAEGWELLFDGVSVSGWSGIHSDMFPETGWEVRDGALVTTETGAGDIITVGQYGEFDLRWEWRMDSMGGNSGVKYFVQEQGDDSQTHGIGLEYQILDDANHEWMLEGKMKPNDYHTLGALYELYPPAADKVTRSLGEWNSSRIVSRKGQVQHWLNGALILEFEKGSEDFRGRVAASKFKDVEWFGRNERGQILLQDHGSVVHFRNLKIRDLSDGE